MVGCAYHITHNKRSLFNMAKRGLAQVTDPKRRREIAAMGGRASRGGGRPKKKKE